MNTWNLRNGCYSEYDALMFTGTFFSLRTVVLFKIKSHLPQALSRNLQLSFEVAAKNRLILKRAPALKY